MQSSAADFKILQLFGKSEDNQDISEPLTGDVLNKMYGDILNKYYGHDMGVCYIDDKFAVESGYVPHFYYNFYV